SPSFRNYATGLYEVDVTHLLHTLLRRSTTFVDLGANIGYYTLLGARWVGSRGHVYAFEPDPIAYAYLVNNVANNRCDNITVINKAVGSTTGVVNFVAVEQERGFVSLGTKDGTPIQQTSLDQ